MNASFLSSLELIIIVLSELLVVVLGDQEPMLVGEA